MNIVYHELSSITSIYSQKSSLTNSYAFGIETTRRKNDKFRIRNTESDLLHIKNSN